MMLRLAKAYARTKLEHNILMQEYESYITEKEIVL
jgi:hypothetical protein